MKGFHSLLQAVEAEDLEGRIEIHIYLTAKIEWVPALFTRMRRQIANASDDKMNNLLIQDVGAEKDTITNLRAPTHFGRPNVSSSRCPIRLVRCKLMQVGQSL